MITPFDDYCIHQTLEPLAVPGTSDRNFYDRYWFNGYRDDASVFFEVGLGIYPNRHVMDAHFSVVVEGVQHNFHASRRAPLDRTHTRIGPMRVEILEPMRRVRVVVDPNDTGIACDLTFEARSCPLEEPRSLLTEGVRVLMHTTRFTQFGNWRGHIEAGGTRHEIALATTPGARDKSWGVRPIGEPEGGAPGMLNNEPGIYWMWAPIHFGDFCTHYACFQDRDGNPTQESGAIVPCYQNLEEIPEDKDPGLVECPQYSHKVNFKSGTRWPASATIELTPADAEPMHIELEPLKRFQMSGLGYYHPAWGHGHWKGEEAFGSDSWKLDEVEPLAMENIHVHHVVKARMGDRQGIGTLETLCIGRHAPSGMKDFFDPAP